MTAAPAQWVPPVTTLILRLAALLYIAMKIQAFQTAMPLPSAAAGQHLDWITIHNLSLVLGGMGTCVLVFVFAPALTAWSQLGTALEPVADAASDRLCRALILITAIVPVLAKIEQPVAATILALQSPHDPFERIWSLNVTYELAALVCVIVLSPALGAGFNALRRLLRDRKGVPGF